MNLFEIKLAVTALLICFAHAVYSQQNSISIRFKPVFGSVPLEIGKKYAYKGDSVEIETLKFYISAVKFYQDDQWVGETEKKHHLINLDNQLSQIIYQANSKNITFNRLVFSFGVDSATNESGAHGDDLDPVNGMYWEWRSGYINLKLEGKSRICPARKNQFTLHIGGYQYPFNTIQNINLPVFDSTKIVVLFNVADLLNNVNIAEWYEVMSPNEKATAIAQKAASAFNTVP